MQTLTTS